MEEVVLRAMKVDPKARFATIEDFGRALLPFASGRARVIWEEAFAGGAAGELPPGRPSIADVPDADAADARGDADAARAVESRPRSRAR